MAISTAAATFGPYSSHHPGGKVLVQTNGGSLTIEMVMGNGHTVLVPDGTVTADAALAIDVRGGTYLVTPTGGCVFEWLV